VTSTDGLPPEGRDGNNVVVTAKLIGPLGVQMTRLTLSMLGEEVNQLTVRLHVARPGVQ